eukprot:12880684-Prorocentrum_lima.AAC.1
MGCMHGFRVSSTTRYGPPRALLEPRLHSRQVLLAPQIPPLSRAVDHRGKKGVEEGLGGRT